MPKFIIIYAGVYEVVEAKDNEAAEKLAYQAWIEYIEHDYGVEDYSKEYAIELGLEEPDEEE